MKPYGIKKDWNAWDDFTKKASPAFADSKANKNKATRARCKKTLKARARKNKIERK